MRQYFLLILCMICYSMTHSQQIVSLDNGIISNGISRQSPLRDVDYSENGIVVTYTFEEGTILQDPIYEGCYMWKIVGFGNEDTPTKPAIPYRIDSFNIPDNNSIYIEIIDSAFVEIPLSISPSRPPLTDSGNETYSRNNVPNISEYHGFYPVSPICLNSISKYRGKNIANLVINPVQCDYENKIVRAYSRISYRLTFTTEDSAQSIKNNSFIDKSDFFLNNIAINSVPQTLRNRSNNFEAPTIKKGYLIISTSLFSESVAKLAKWKELLGFKTQIIMNDNWTTNAVNEAVADAYNNDSTLYYLLIVGDMENVPAQNSTLKRNHVTDFYYSCLDGTDDTTPDLLYGRIPVKTSDEANIVIDKIINYEKSPVIDSVFYRTGLHCAYFQDDNRNTYADRRFAQTSEDIRNSLLDEGFNLTRVYYTENDITPLYWNNTSFSFGEPIPEEIKKPTFTWTGNAADINSTINNGTLFVLHRDHGAVSKWGSPLYSKSNIRALSNGNKLPVVFSLNCLTGKFNTTTSDCFCESFLKKENGGCVAIFGATETSYSGYNDALAEGMFDAIWPSTKLRPTFPYHSAPSGITPHPTYELGQILNQGKARMTEIYGVNSTYTIYTKELFHCFGDPSMKIYTAPPTQFSSLVLNRDSNFIHVELNDSNATIVFNDLITGETVCENNSFATYSTNHPANVTVCVSGHNKIPFISEGVSSDVLYIQNTTISGYENFEANEIIVGRNVVQILQEGPVIFNSGKINLKANSVCIESDTTINVGTEVNISN